MLTSRSPRVLWTLAQDFGEWYTWTMVRMNTAHTFPTTPIVSDTLFNVGNMLVWACCLSASFRWDERAVPVILAIMMNAVLVILGDAACSDFEYSVRSIFLIFTALMCFSGDVSW